MRTDPPSTTGDLNDNVAAITSTLFLNSPEYEIVNYKKFSLVFIPQITFFFSLLCLTLSVQRRHCLKCAQNVILTETGSPF